MSNIDQDALTIRRLNQYRPFERGGASAREAQEDLLLAVLAEAGSEIATVGLCSTAIKTLWGIELDDVETARAMSVLIGEQRVERDEDGYRLTADECARLELVAAESDASTSTAITEWRAYLLEQWPGLDPAQLDRMERDLTRFLHFVVARHGAEATLALYPEDAQAEQRYADLEALGFAVLDPAEAEIEHIGDGAISHFVRRPSESQRAYLAQVLTTGYFMSVLSIDGSQRNRGGPARVRGHELCVSPSGRAGTASRATCAYHS